MILHVTAQGWVMLHRRTDFFSDHTGRPEAVHGVVVLALIIAVILGAARRDQKAVPLEFKPCRH